MIDIIYQIIKTVMNKELRGNITPDEFNKIAKQVQDEMYAEYFGDLNLQKVKDNRGLVNKNFANLPRLIRQKITRFRKNSVLSHNIGTGLHDLPGDLYFIEDNGLLYLNNVIDEVHGAGIGYLSASSAAPSLTFPCYEGYEDAVKIYPLEIISNVTCNYLRRPRDPKWTYTSVGSIELFDNSILDYQDFELHTSELPKIAVNMLSYLGMNVKEVDITQYAEGLKQIGETKEQQQ